MSTSAIELRAPLAESVSADAISLTVELSDGRTISVPTSSFPRLLDARQAERDDWQLVGRGQGIHWPQLDEDVSVEGLLAGRASRESASSLKRWLSARRRDDQEAGHSG